MFKHIYIENVRELCKSKRGDIMSASRRCCPTLSARFFRIPGAHFARGHYFGEESAAACCKFHRAPLDAYRQAGHTCKPLWSALSGAF
eukprot:2091748-Pleurochrysis_carterae.AAC.2